ncbi:hypothetical protein B0T17DRAFT_358227 [Bombardia bombarda]|uniref:Uncharacterized protein n=1 Tax=Bombardia bombarda TaxID=252184 RepID=A0AA40BW43_9PEZI|nr:hypothetical protein B0T17DRAFT_358227 [Bombardia bombarda]
MCSCAHGNWDVTTARCATTQHGVRRTPSSRPATPRPPRQPALLLLPCCCTDGRTRGMKLAWIMDKGYLAHLASSSALSINNGSNGNSKGEGCSSLSERIRDAPRCGSANSYCWSATTTTDRLVYPAWPNKVNRRSVESCWRPLHCPRGGTMSYTVFERSTAYLFLAAGSVVAAFLPTIPVRHDMGRDIRDCRVGPAGTAGSLPISCGHGTCRTYSPHLTD